MTFWPNHRQVKIKEWLCGFQTHIKMWKNFRWIHIFLEKELDLEGYWFSFYKSLTWV